MVNTHEASDMRQAMEGTATRDDRSERLLRAALTVWTAAVPNRDDPDRFLVSREAMEALGAALADFPEARGA